MADHLSVQAHGTDLMNAFGPGDLTDYFIHFVEAGRATMQFIDVDVGEGGGGREGGGLEIGRDMQRLEETDVLERMSVRFPI